MFSSRIINSLANIAFWIAIPTVRLTEKSEYKAVRLLGFALGFPLAPLAIIGVTLLFFCIVADFIYDI